jgi:hypothetical protein
MCKGEIKVHVNIVMDNGKTVNKHFKINVGDEWHNIIAEMQECNCRSRMQLRQILEEKKEEAFSMGDVGLALGMVFLLAGLIGYISEKYYSFRCS